VRGARWGKGERGRDLSRDEGPQSAMPHAMPAVPLLAHANSATLHAPRSGPLPAPRGLVGYPSGMSSHSGAARASYTWDDFIALEEDDLRELIDGELVEVEVPTRGHEGVVSELVIDLGNWGRTHGGRVYASGYKVRVSGRSGVMPDVQFYRAGNEVPADQNQGLVRGHADLVVEVVSPSSRGYDRVTKLAWYARLGVPEYWIADPEARTLERFLLSDETYVPAESLRGDEVFRPDTFEGLEIPLSRLWA
jgi:Uma2 family endonuclease